MIWRFAHSLKLLDYFFKMIPLRIGRVFGHLSGKSKTYYASKKILFWQLELLLLLLDLFGLAELYQLVLLWIRKSLRPVNTHELSIISSLLQKDCINTGLMLINPRAYIGPKHFRFAYVSFHIINYWDQIYDDTFVHELIHIWQYQKEGSVYIPRALYAQRSKEKYNYGGVEGLKKLIRRGQSIEALNYEQQGDLLADYFRIKKGKLKLRGVGRIELLGLYAHILRGLVK